MSKIQKGDRVIVLSGEDRGKEGVVLKVDPGKSRAIVQGINFVKRHQKPTQTNPQGGIVEKEGPVHMSNLMVIDPKTNQATKTRLVKLENGHKVRVSKISGEMITGSAQ
ncbi:MAG: 50S ribosomal protein L24 [Candidatus Latescibacteria bacterium]|nr:50S ribosomal protein L24 [Candidatus Latescibacterota bacterium]